MGKVRRGNYIFISWKGDHGNHVHVFRKEKQIVKWDLDEGCEIEGKASRKLIELIKELQEERKI